MGRLLRIITAAIAYLCVATVITECLLAGYALSKGYLDKEKVTKMIAVAQGVDSSSTDSPINDVIRAAEPSEQPSIEDIEKRRAIQTRNLELREQSLHTSVDQLKFEQQKLADEKQTYDRQKSAFEKQLAELQTGVQATGRENIRLIWENIKPKQSKEQILQMIAAGEQADVVAILSAMPIAKRAKIIGEFKTEEEAKKLEDILRLIREGVPEAKVVDQAQQQLRGAEKAAANVAGASNAQAEIAGGATNSGQQR